MKSSRLTGSLRQQASRIEVGAAPGAIRTDDAARPTHSRLTSVSADRCVTVEQPSIGAIREAHRSAGLVWVHVTGFADTDWIRELGELFDVHELALADIVNLHQRPKLEEYTDHLFVVIRQPIVDETLHTQQLALYIGDRFLLSFAEQSPLVIAALDKRLGDPRSLLRHHGSDFLAYAIIDYVIDSFFPVLEEYGERLEALETRTIEQPDPSTNREIHHMRSDLLLLRRAVWPLREVINELIRGTSPLVEDHTRLYLRDSYDHAIRALDTVETYRELAFGLTDLYMSSLSSRMNEIMKVLTIIATVFMPLSFVASLYGMNFDRTSPLNMPELGWPYGYIFALGLMAGVAGSMVWYFWRKGWIGVR